MGARTKRSACRHCWVPFRGRVGSVLHRQTAAGSWEPVDNLKITAVKCVRCGAVKRLGRG